MDFEKIIPKEITINSFTTVEETKFLDLLNGGISFQNALNVLKETFPHLGQVSVVPASILLKCHLTSLDKENWPELAKYLIQKK